jgi:hypothetical protein
MRAMKNRPIQHTFRGRCVETADGDVEDSGDNRAMSSAAKFDEKAVYSSIGEMMQAASEAAVVQAVRQYGFVLDYSEASVAHLDPILAQVATQPAVDVERETKLWGAYFGETVRHLYGGEWEFTQYPGSATAVPTVLARGIHLYPLMKVYRRLTLGEGERLDAFYAMLKQKLKAQPAANPAD